MEITGLGITTGTLLLGLISIIFYFIKQNIEAKDERLKAQDAKIKEIENDYDALKIKVTECRGEISNLGADVRENRTELIKALNGIKDFVTVNEKIEKQLDRSNVLMERGNNLHEDLKDLITKIVEVKSK